jgi:hypothetical protein
MIYVKRTDVPLSFCDSFQQIYQELGRWEDRGGQAGRRWQGRRRLFQNHSRGRHFYKGGLVNLVRWLHCRMFARKNVYGICGFKRIILIELKQHRSLHQERLAVYQQIERMHLLILKHYQIRLISLSNPYQWYSVWTKLVSLSCKESVLYA